MRIVVRRKSLGDRMIAVVGMLVAASVVALLGFAVLVAKSVDQASAMREIELARAKVAQLAVQMKNELVQVTRWDDAVNLAADISGLEWVHNHFGLRLHRIGGHDYSFIVNGDGTPVYASDGGKLAGIEVYRRVESAIEPVVREVLSDHFAKLNVQLALGQRDEFGATYDPAVAVSFRRVGGRPALVGAMTIVPHSRSKIYESTLPTVAVSVSFLGEAVLGRIARDIAADNVKLVDGVIYAGALGNGTVAVEVPIENGERPAWFVWEPKAPGAGMLVKLLPALVGVIILLGIATMIVLLYVRRTTERLDHSERRATELAYRDRLTGLANRVQLMETLTEQLDRIPQDERLALVLIDLDDFQNINDTLGHPTGDEVLFAAGERLTALVEEKGMAVRFGADEFALLVPVGKDDKEVQALCRRVIDAMRSPIIAGGQFLTVGTTSGAAIAPDDAVDAEQLLRRADIALYRAKAEQRGGYRLFDPAYEEALHRRSAIERDLKRAIAGGELSVKFQPLYAANGERIVGVEALVRWDHPERGVVPPSEFIPVAEQTGLVVKIDEWVLRRACEQAAHWPGLSLAVNLSAANFRQGNVSERIARVLADTGFDSRRLEVEITESVLLNATADVLGELSELRRLGVRIALDDFGTGYSSLGYLRRFPVDKLKIDKSFVQNLGITEDAAAIIECVTRLGRALGLAVTAEGVETGEQHRFVRAVGCHQVQGYLFSPPIDAEQIDALLGSETSAPSLRKLQRLATA